MSDEQVYDTMLQINSAWTCPLCNGDCISLFPRHFMIEFFEYGKRSIIFCKKCDYEISGNQLEKELFTN